MLPGHAPCWPPWPLGRCSSTPAADTAVAVDGGFLHVAHEEEDVTRVDILAEHALLPDEALGQDTAEDRERRAELRSEDRLDEARRSRPRRPSAAGSPRTGSAGS